MSYPLPGELRTFDRLAVPRARSLAQVLQAEDLNFVRLIELRHDKASGAEIIVVEVEVELSQHPVVDIRALEMLAFVFPANDDLPRILALRPDFPSVAHVNIRLDDGPLSLCLYDLPWSEVKRQWTPRGMIERAREWLALTARGGLHTLDQPLEPFLFGSHDTIVIPDIYVVPTKHALPLLLKEVDGGNNRRVFVTTGMREGEEEQEVTFMVAAPFWSTPRTHGVITRNPETLQELHQFFADNNDDLLDQLRNLLLQFRKEHCRQPYFIAALLSHMVLIAILPKTRTDEARPETMEIRAFLTDKSVWDLGIEIGIWDRGTDDFGPSLLYDLDLSKQGESVALTLLEAVFELSPGLAARYSGLPGTDVRRVAQVGVGAIGSQLLLHLVREGWGTWTLIDNDYLLPHNLARHAADGRNIGRPKAIAMAEIANSIISSQEIARGIIADALDMTHVEMLAALAESDVIIDTSASVTVARHLSNNMLSSARRISIFLNPSGTDGVLLAEDSKRSIPLDLLEMQYYRALSTNPELSNHLQRKEEPIRYGGTCRDISFQMPQELVGVHAAMASRAVRSSLNQEDAAITIWRTNDTSFDISSITISPSSLIEVAGVDWTLRADQQLLDRVAEIRNAKLPNETGGILIGSFDTERRIVYVIDVIPAPPDSEEWPHLFIRGRSGLAAQVENIRRMTDGMLDYVGEWHSHPNGHSCAASHIDCEAFDALADVLRADALPPLMLIAGQDGAHQWYLEQMPSNEDSVN